jgi:hypothetical protein
VAQAPAATCLTGALRAARCGRASSQRHLTGCAHPRTRPPRPPRACAAAGNPLWWHEGKTNATGAALGNGAAAARGARPTTVGSPGLRQLPAAPAHTHSAPLQTPPSRPCPAPPAGANDGPISLGGPNAPRSLVIYDEKTSAPMVCCDLVPQGPATTNWTKVLEKTPGAKPCDASDLEEEAHGAHGAHGRRRRMLRH